jgi:hypothetical protein
MGKKICIFDLVSESKVKILEEHKERMYRQRGVDVYLVSELEEWFYSAALPLNLREMDEVHLPLDDGNLEMVRYLTVARVLEKPVIFFSEAEETEDEEQLRKLLEDVWGNDEIGLRCVYDNKIAMAKKPYQQFMKAFFAIYFVLAVSTSLIRPFSTVDTSSFWFLALRTTFHFTGVIFGVAYIILKAKN